MRDIDLIIQKVKERFPEVEVEQLKVKFPADDDGVWYFYLPKANWVQIESSYGMCPFIVETHRQNCLDARKANTVDEVVKMIVEDFEFETKNLKPEI
jgi:hypothetical protein